MGEYVGMLAERDGGRKIEPATDVVRLQIRELAKHFTPVELYCYLKSQIGFANGILMIEPIFGPASSDDLCHWQFVLKSPSSFAEFQSSQNGLMLFLYSAPILSESDWLAIENSLRRELETAREKTKRVKAGLEDWVVFVNPYKRLNDVVATLEERASGIRLVEPELPSLSLASGGWSADQREAFLENSNTYHQALIDAQLIGVAIRTTVPIWIESFVNLLLFALAKPRIKNDKRLFESQIRQQIDVRVKMLSDTCEGFHRSVSDDDEEFKEMQRLFQRRNTNLHGSIDVDALTTDRVFFDGNRPVYNEWLPDYSRRMPKVISFIEPMAARDDILVGSEFIIYLANLVDKSIRNQIWAIADTPLLGYRKDNKRLGILFSGPIVFPVFTLSKDE